MLKTRLYFLMHDLDEVRRSLDEISNYLGKADYRLHVMGAVEGQPTELAEHGVYQRSAQTVRRERYLAISSTAVFVVALIGLGAALLAGAWSLSVLLALLVFAMQLSGYVFSDRPGNAELDRFRDNLDEGDTLLMVDVPPYRSAEVERIIRAKHPAAEPGGSGWYLDALGP